MGRYFIILFLLFAAMSLASKIKIIPANDHSALAKEGIKVLKQIHVQTAVVSTPPPVCY